VWLTQGVFEVFAVQMLDFVPAGLAGIWPLADLPIPAWLKPTLPVLLGAAGAGAALWILLAVLRQVAPRVAAIGATTAKEATHQTLFWVLLGGGLFALLIFPFIPYNTFGEDIKVIKDEGLTLIMVLSIVLALWTASTSIADEIDGRTALTLLSKPIARWQFIVGKFLGVITPVAILFIVLGAMFLGTVSYKVAYDAREMAMPPPTAAQCAQEMQQIVPGLVLSFMEALVLASIGVAVSTRLPIVPNLIICGAVYVLGHLSPLLLQSSAQNITPVRFMARLFTTVLPVLENFNVQAAVATGAHVPLSYLALVGGYCLLYVSMSMVLALLLFESRDLG
jgi:ABC-type transport system involved in multi-copper enzyme maturation permease subunit